MITVEELRKRYPHPLPFSSGRKTPTGYCVGGALRCSQEENRPIRSLAESKRFPPTPELAEALQWENPQLGKRNSLSFAESIVNLNDEGDFSEAWLKLHKALSYGRG